MKSARFVPPRSATNRKIAFKLIACGISLLVGIAGAEILVRVAGIAPDFRPIVLDQSDTVYKRSSNPLLAYELKPNYRDPNADLVTSYPFTNLYGQRDIERQHARKPGAKRIVILGDSVVEGLGTRELDALVNRQLEALHPSGTLEALNFGVSGYNTLASIELLETKALAFEPDTVVLVFVENDFNNFNREAFELAGSEERPSWADFLFRNSDLSRTVFVRFNLFNFGAEQNPIEWNRKAMGDNNVVEGLKRFAALAEAHRFYPLIAIWPRFTNTGIRDKNPVKEQPATLVVEALANEFGLRCFRFSKYFETHAQLNAIQNPRLAYSVGDEMHPSALGARVAARSLKSELEKLPSASQQDFERRSQTPARSSVIQAARDLGSLVPNDSAVYYNRGRKLSDRGMASEAIAAYRVAIQADPKAPKPRNELGILLVQQGRIDEAVPQFRQAAKLDANFSEAFMNLGNTELRLGNLQEAARAYLSALNAQPDLAPAHFALSQIYYSLKQIPPSKSHLLAAVAQDPRHSEARHLLGVILVNEGDIQGGLEQLRIALQLDPGNAKIESKLNKLAPLEIRP